MLNIIPVSGMLITPWVWAITYQLSQQDPTKVTGQMEFKMVKGPKCMKMVQIILDSSKKVLNMVKESSIIQMELFMKDNLRTSSMKNTAK